MIVSICTRVQRIFFVLCFVIFCENSRLQLCLIVLCPCVEWVGSQISWQTQTHVIPDIFSRYCIQIINIDKWIFSFWFTLVGFFGWKRINCQRCVHKCFCMYCFLFQWWSSQRIIEIFSLNWSVLFCLRPLCATFALLPAILNCFCYSCLYLCRLNRWYSFCWLHVRCRIELPENLSIKVNMSGWE